MVLAPGAAYCAGVEPPDVQGEVGRILAGLDFAPWQSALNQAQADLTIASLVAQLSAGGNTLSLQWLLSALLGALLGQLPDLLSTMLKLLAVAMLAGLLLRSNTALQAAGSAKLVAIIATCGTAGLILSILLEATRTSTAAITLLVHATQAMLPLHLGLLSATGAAASATMLQGSFLLLLQGTSWVSANLLQPVVLYGAILGISGRLVDKDALCDLSAVLRNAFVWCAGALLTLLVAFTGMQSHLSTSFDGISMKTAKYAIDSMVPYVGGLFSDMADTLLGCSVIVKGAIGTAGLVSVLLVLAKPLCYCACAALGLRLVGAFCPLLGAEHIKGLFDEGGRLAQLLAIILLIVGAAFILMLATLSRAGSNVIVYR